MKKKKHFNSVFDAEQYGFNRGLALGVFLAFMIGAVSMKSLFLGALGITFFLLYSALRYAKFGLKPWQFEPLPDEELQG